MDSTQFYLQEFLEIIIKRKRLISLFLVLVVVMVTLATLRQQKIYRAKTTVEVGVETPNISFYKEVVTDSPQNWWSIQTYYETEYKIIKSRNLMGIVADKMIDKGLVPKNTKRESLISMLHGSIGVDPVEKSRLVIISLDSPDPKRAALLSNMVADAYVEENLNKKIRGAKQAAEILNKQMEIFSEEKSKSDDKLQNFKEQHNIVSLENKQNIVKENLVSLNESLNEVKNQRIRLEAKYRALNSIVNNTKDSEKLFGTVNSDLMTSLKTDYDNLVREQGELKKRYKEKHPRIVELNVKIEEIFNSAKREAESEVSRLKTEYLLTRAQENSISKSLENQKMEALKIDKLQLKMQNISSVQEANKTYFEGLNKKMKEAGLTGLINSNNIKVVDRALIPTTPVKPNVKMNILMAIAFGLFGGIGLAYIIEGLDNTVKSEEDIEKYCKVPMLGIIPLHQPKNGNDSQVKIELMTATDPKSSFSEVYKTIRTNLAFLSSTHGYKNFLITSAGEKDGKTTSAFNLATSISQTGAKTLLIDMDLRKSSVSKVLDIQKEDGLSDFLAGMKSLEECIKNSGISPSLDVMTTGTLPPNPAELLESPKTKEVIAELKNRYDRIIIDSSPIAPVTDSTIIAQMVDAVILIVGADKTVKSLLKTSMNQLLKVNANIIGVIFNGFNIEKKRYFGKYYNYGYYSSSYRYGKDESKDSKPEKRIDA